MLKAERHIKTANQNNSTFLKRNHRDRRAWSVFQVLKENSCQLKLLLYPAKISDRIEVGRKNFYD